jgi:pimeloyl-ACP methyl ester carboxylesterase
VHHWWCREIDSVVPLATSESVDWTGHAWPITVLQAYKANHIQAQKIAERLITMRRANPDAKIVLSAESGGTGVAVWALEDLPDDVKIDSVILLSPALSPGYDLSLALRHISGSMHVFISERDKLILGWGTETYGTIDGKNTQAAGRFGFVAPKSADPAQYAKVIQVPYRSSWWRYLNFGGHAESMSPSFGKNVIAPLIADGAVRG